MNTISSQGGASRLAQRRDAGGSQAAVKLRTDLAQISESDLGSDGDLPPSPISPTLNASLASLNVTPICTDKTPTNSIHVDPPSSKFKGREAELEQLRSALIATEKGIVLREDMRVIIGEGSVGKSELAKAFVHRNKHHYAFIGWVSCQTKMAQTKSLLALADALELEGHTHNERLDSLRAYFRLNAGWLLIYDDVQSNAVPEYYDGTGQILVTTRESSVGNPKINVILGGLSRDESLDLLYSGVTSDETGSISTDDAKLLVKLTGQNGDHPLALRLVASAIRLGREKDPSFSLERYIDYYTNSPQASIRPGNSNALYPQSINKACTFLMEQLSIHCTAEFKILMVISFFETDDLPLFFLMQALPDDLYQDVPSLKEAFSKSLGLLNMLSILELSSSKLSIPQAIRDAVYDAIPNNEKPKWLQSILYVLEENLNLLEPNNPMSMMFWGQLYPHILSVIDRAKQTKIDSEMRALIVLSLGLYEFYMEDFDTAEVSFTQSLGLYQNSLQDTHFREGSVYHNLAAVYVARGDLEGALLHYDKAINVRHDYFVSQNSFTDDQRVVVGDDYTQKGMTLFALGRYKESLKCLNEGYAYYRRVDRLSQERYSKMSQHYIKVVEQHLVTESEA